MCENHNWAHGEIWWDSVGLRIRTVWNLRIRVLRVVGSNLLVGCHTLNVFRFFCRLHDVVIQLVCRLVGAGEIVS